MYLVRVAISNEREERGMEEGWRREGEKEGERRVRREGGNSVNGKHLSNQSTTHRNVYHTFRMSLPILVKESLL